MSVTVDSKIEMIRKLLFEEIENKHSEKKDQIVKNYEEKKHAIEAEAEEIKQNALSSAQKKAENERQHMYAKVQAEEHYKVLRKRQEFLEKTIEILRNLANRYTGEKSYWDGYLEKNLNQAVKVLGDSQTIHYHFTKSDIERYGKLIGEKLTAISGDKKYEIHECSDEIIGGFFAEDDEKVMQVDYTIKALIDDNRELIGTNISRRLGEVIS